MTAVSAANLTEISVSDLPYDRSTGTAKRRALVSIRCTSGATSDTIALASYIPGIADIEGVAYNSVDSAVSATAPTWSTTTLTLAQHAGSGVCEFGVIVNFS